MRLLLHWDFLQTLAGSNAPSPAAEALLKLCQSGKAEAWILGATLPLALEKSGLPQSAAAAKLREWLDVAPILSLTARETQECLQAATPFAEALAARAIKACRLDAMITLNAAPTAGAAALRPEDAVQRLQNAPPAASVPLLDLTASYHETWRDVEQSMADVMRSGQFILGPKVAELEKRIAAYCQCPHAIGVSSGTDALLLALMAENIGPGDEVITTPYTFFATMGSIARMGAKPVLVDIEADTFNIDPARLEEKITARTKAIIPVHLFGQCADMDPIMEIAKRRRLCVIEDAAQAIGAEYKFRRAGSFGHYGCFSFFPTKNLGGFGDGGIITTASAELLDKLDLLRVHGSRPKYYHKIIGGNFRIDALQAAIILEKLKYLEGWTGKRRENAANYHRLFKEYRLGSIRLPQEVFPRHIYNQYVIRVPGKRDELRDFLKNNGIGTEVYYPIPLHLQECFAYLGCRAGDFPIAESVAQDSLALPISQEVSLAQQTYVVEKIRDFLSQKG